MPVGVNRNGTMSSQCLHFRTAIMTAGAKPLIAWECWAVAEQRQGARQWSVRNNRNEQLSVNGVSSCCSKTRTTETRKISSVELFSMYARLGSEGR